MRTLLLDVSTWDLVSDALGNIAVASNPYSLAQDVASAIKLFQGEAWYDTSRGVPWFQTFLGRSPPVAVFQETMQQAALTVPEVERATCIIQGFENRVVQGAVTFVDSTGNTQTVSIGA